MRAWKRQKVTNYKSYKYHYLLDIVNHFLDITKSKSEGKYMVHGETQLFKRYKKEKH